MPRLVEKMRRRSAGGGAGEHCGRPTGHQARGCGLACTHCGLVLETPALRCPRCLTPIALGCDGNCRECGAKGC